MAEKNGSFSELEEWLVRNKFVPAEEILSVLQTAGITSLVALLYLERSKLDEAIKSLKVVQRKKIINALESTAIMLLTTTNSALLDTKKAVTIDPLMIEELSFVRSELTSSQTALATAEASYQALLTAKDREICELKLRLEFAKGVSLPDPEPEPMKVPAVPIAAPPPPPPLPPRAAAVVSPPPPPPPLLPSKEPLYMEMSKAFERTRCNDTAGLSRLQSMEASEPLAAAFLSLCYYYGYAMTKNPTEGSRRARSVLSFLTDHSEGRGSGSDPAIVKHCQYLLAVFNFDGIGIERNTTKHFALASASARQGYALAMNGVGNAYLDGKGVTKNEAEGLRYFRLAADQDYADAQYNVGWCYCSAKGTVKNDVEAMRWFRLAADHGLSDAQYSVGMFYAEGRGGVKKDVNEARKWYKLSAAHGNEYASKALKKLPYSFFS